MTIDIGKLRDGSLAAISNEPFPAKVRHVEYYREQRLFQFVFEDPAAEELLITQELDLDGAKATESAPDIMIVVMAEAGAEPRGYDVPLIQIGV